MQDVVAQRLNLSTFKWYYTTSLEESCVVGHHSTSLHNSIGKVKSVMVQSFKYGSPRLNCDPSGNQSKGPYSNTPLFSTEKKAVCGPQKLIPDWVICFPDK